MSLPTNQSQTDLTYTFAAYHAWQTPPPSARWLWSASPPMTTTDGSTLARYKKFHGMYVADIFPSQERDQMAPDAVQYARALRPPYHLLSFLRLASFTKIT